MAKCVKKANEHKKAMCGLDIDEVIGSLFLHGPIVTSRVFLKMLQCYAIPQAEYRYPSLLAARWSSITLGYHC